MLCAKLSARKDGFKFPCGQCQNCRINKRREWQARLLLEAASHEYGAFVTLTFADTGVPPVLRKSDVKTFIRAVREADSTLRHYTAGEYGSRTGRAHYHSHLFSSVPFSEVFLRSCWPYGNIHVGDSEPASLDYVLGYLLKPSKVIRWPVEERFPEFRSYSKGMGKFALNHLLVDGAELSREFRVYGRAWPVGRYLRDRAKKMGFTVSERQEVVLEALEARAMRDVLASPGLSPEDSQRIYQEFWEKKKLKSQELQKKAIRAAYVERHGYVQRSNKNETF